MKKSKTSKNINDRFLQYACEDQGLVRSRTLGKL